jgi:hypothetical protein
MGNTTVTPVSSPESRECPSDDLDDTYIELDDDFIAKAHATHDANDVKKLLARHAVRYNLSPDAKFAASPINISDKCRWISCRKNMGYHATDPKIRTQGAEHGRSWIVMKHGDGSLESSNAQHTAERDAELYPGSGPSW